MAKASSWNGPDGEGRNPGERAGLDTRVVLAKRCGLGVGWPRAAPVPKGTVKSTAWEVRSQD